jgi:hypothetical protein
MHKINRNHTIGKRLKELKGVYKLENGNIEVTKNEEFNKYVAWLE